MTSYYFIDKWHLQCLCKGKPSIMLITAFSFFVWIKFRIRPLLIIFQNRIRMQEIYEESINNQNIQTLESIMLNFPYFLELKQSYSEKDFTQLISTLQYEKIVRKQPLVLQPGYLYFFLGRGAIFRREPTGKTQKLIKGKQKTWVSTVSKGVSNPNESKDSPRFHIQQFDSYEEPQNLSKYVQDFYYPSNHKHTTVLYINVFQLKPHLYNRIKESAHSKLRFISNAEGMFEVDRTIINDRIHKFKYIQLHYGQTLYSRGIRHSLVFILKSGLVEVLAGKKKRSGYVVNPKSLLAIQKTEDEWGRCVSEKVECYSIPMENFVAYFPNLAQSTAFFSRRLKTFQDLQSSCITYTHGDQNTPILSPAANISIDQKSQTMMKGNISKRRFQHRSMQDLKDSDRKKGRMLALRQHFSNYYNEMFDQFSQQKIKQTGFGEIGHESLNLYKIKVLQRRAPAMDELKNRLKKIRMEKFNAYKDRMKRKVYIQAFQGSGVTVIEQQL